MALMRRHLRHACAAATAGAALCLAAPATAAVAAPGRAPSSIPAVSGRLYGTAATSASDVWAVGLDPGGALIMHWNGTAWSSPSLSDFGFLQDVAATSASNAWSVGGTDWFSPATLIYHWDGSTWTRQASPNPGGGGFLNGVAAASASDAWAVGLIGGGPGAGTGPGDRTLIEHWDGTAWTQVASPTPAPAGALSRVAVVSPSDAWAVGWTGAGTTGNTFHALIEHWDGRSWNLVPVPASIGADIRLNSVTATSASNAWAVGSTTTGPDYGVILHWNGTTWRKVAAHSPTGSLLGVSASSPSNAWAVGQGNASSGGCDPKCTTIIEHWNGCMWSVVPSPNPPSGYLNDLWDVAIVDGRDAWAVGTTDYASTLIVHWNGTSWS